MSYQVLARKWRPRTFAELVGQEHVVRPLVNALDNDRVHHAFLFTGTRGVGKTTIARIFAKSLNCERGVSSQPCGQCSACGEVDTGRFVDLIEVDAASRTKVEDTRELLDNVQYAPTRARYKVYLVDEVHMLSNHSFNALLKTLEEPPQHVKFLLATTDPQRLPVTILSRCLQFNLKRLPVKLIAQHLASILDQESITYDRAALSLIARAGDGSIRDALSLLDQAISFGINGLSLTDVSTMLGSVDQHHVQHILDALANHNASLVLQTVAEIDQRAPDYDAILAQLLTWLQRIALVQMVPQSSLGEDFIAQDVFMDNEPLQQLATIMSPEDVQLFYQIALLGRRDLPLAPDARGGFEMILLRMLCFLPARSDFSATDNDRKASVSPSFSVPAPLQERHAPKTAVQVKAAVLSSAGPEPDETESTLFSSDTASVVAEDTLSGDVIIGAANETTDNPDWNRLVETLGLTALAKQLAVHCIVKNFSSDTVELLLDPRHAQVRTSNTEERLQMALEKHFRRSLRLKIEIGEQSTFTPAQEQAQHQVQLHQAAVDLIEQDPNIKAMQETFNARITPGSIIATD